MAHSDIEVVCFDLGGVLVRAVDGGWVAACKLAGVPIRKEIGELARNQNLADWNDKFETGDLSAEKFIKMLCVVTKYEPGQIQMIFQNWLLDLYPGVVELLDKLNETGVRLACLSNTNPIHWQQLLTQHDRFGALDRLHHKFASHLINKRKPNLEAYEHVENELDVDPEEILFFDDMKYNIDAAIENYWNAEKIDSRNDHVRQMNEALERYGIF